MGSSRSSRRTFSPSRADAIRVGCLSGILYASDHLGAVAESDEKAALYRLIPRHVITQSSQPEGANLIGRMMPTRSFLCSPLRPAQHVAPVASCVTDAEWTALMAADAWQGAGEDWPGAYRQSPISPSEALGCVRYVFGTTNGKPWLSRFIVPCSLDFRWQ